MMIEPTVGRIVLYAPLPNEMPVGHGSTDPSVDASMRCAAIIVAVHGPRMVNLSVFDANGALHPKSSVTLRQPEDETHPPSGFCEWLPYQVKKDFGSESGEKPVGTQQV
jgi:hypothetical protein